MVEVGQKVKFDPFREVTGFASEDCRGQIHGGTVVMVNRPHKWFSVEYDCCGVKMRDSFKFSQIGREVKVYGR